MRRPLQVQQLMARLERMLVILATAATLAVNALANIAGINGVSTGEVANRYDLPFTPAGYVFSIWGLIYAGLLAFTVFQATVEGARSSRVAMLRPVYVFSAVANVAWLWFWHHEALPASLGVMLLLLGAVVAAYRLVSEGPAGSLLERGCVDATFRLYCAWITVATLANLSVVVTHGPVAGRWLGPTGWSLAMIAAALAIAMFVYFRLRDPIFLVVIGWAAAGIALKDGQAMSVSGPAIVVAAIAGLGAIGLLLEGRPERGPQSTTG